MKLLITGANGFVGRFLQSYLSNNHEIMPLCRQRAEQLLSYSGNVSSYGQVDALIHLAGRAHVMHETASNIYLAYREVNVDYTLKVAALANSLGIKRFIFLSSVKVNGETSEEPFNESHTPAPMDAYGQTKLEAELLLKDFCTKHEMELVIIRPPLIYGPNVKANLNSLIKLCKLPIPLPFGNVKNRRSLISLPNLSSFIELCCHHPEAAHQTFLISDDHDVSTAELIRTIQLCLGRKPLLFHLPVWILETMFRITGKKTHGERLLSNLQVNISKAKNLLAWQPVLSFEEGIQLMVKGYVD